MSAGMPGPTVQQVRDGNGGLALFVDDSTDTHWIEARNPMEVQR